MDRGVKRVSQAWHYLWVVLLAFAFSAPMPASAQGSGQVVIDFEGLAEGMIVNDVSSGNGISGPPVEGKVEVFAVRNGQEVFPPGRNYATIFDATCGGSQAGCSGPDPDLFHPEFGNVLVIDRVGDTTGDGFSDDTNGPNDTATGGNIQMDFSQFGTGVVDIESIVVFDQEADEVGDPDGGRIRFFRGNVEVATILIPVTGDSGSAKVELNVDDVQATRIELDGSGAIDEIVLSICEDDVNVANAAASGKAFPVRANFTLGGDGSLDVDLGGTAESSQQGPGTSSDEEGVLSLVLPNTATVELLQSSSFSMVSEGTGDDPAAATSESMSTIANVDIGGGRVRAELLVAKARARATALGATADTSGSKIVGLTIDGNPVEVTGEPSQTIEIPNLGTLHIFERTVTENSNGSTEASASVNLLRLELPASGQLGQLVNGELIVGHADASASFPRNECVEPLGFTVSGEAAVVKTLGPNGVETAFVEAGPLPPSGGSDFATALEVVVRDSDGNEVGRSASAIAETEGGFDGDTASAMSLAEIQSLSLLGGRITADLIRAQSRTSTDDQGGSSSGEGTVIANLVIDGRNVCAELGEEVQNGVCSPPPNTEFPVAIPGVLRIVLNEQQGGDGGSAPDGCGEGDEECTVRAIHIYIADGPIEIIVAEAHSDAHLGASNGGGDDGAGSRADGGGTGGGGGSDGGAGGGSGLGGLGEILESIGLGGGGGGIGGGGGGGVGEGGAGGLPSLPGSSNSPGGTDITKVLRDLLGSLGL